MASVFISHSTLDREFAEQAIVALLEQHGISTWYSRDSIHGADEWERCIKQGLNACAWFLVILSRESVNSEWVRTEVHWALEHRRGRVIPVVIDDCNPADCHLKLIQIQHVNFRSDYSAAGKELVSLLSPSIAIDKTVYDVDSGQSSAGMKRSRPRNDPRASGGRWLGVAACTALIFAIGMGLMWWQIGRGGRGSPNPATPLITNAQRSISSLNHSELALPGGVLMVRTERFEPLFGRHPRDENSSQQDVAKRVLELDKRDRAPHQMELAFQILNRSDRAVTLASLSVASLGTVFIREDKSPALGVAVAHDEMTHFTEDRFDLGTLKFNIEPSTATGGTAETGQYRSTGNLLPLGRVEVLSPHSARSFLVRTNCHSSPLRMTVMVVSRGLTADGPALASLDLSRPEIIEDAHVFSIAVDILTEDGTRSRLYSDYIYAIYPELRDALKVIKTNIEKTETERPLRSWFAAPPDEFIGRMVAWSVKTYRETRAYQLASRDGVLPSDFDPDSVSPYCYFQDMDSPLRRMLPKRSSTESASRTNRDTDQIKLEGKFGVLREERSNLISWLQELRRDHPGLWHSVAAQIDQIVSTDRGILGHKARYVQEQVDVR